jgi:hypothetical protein
MPKYAIRASILRKDDESYVADATVELLDGSAIPMINVVEPCEPCTYARARAECYGMIAKLRHAITKQGGEIAEVTIRDPL